MTRSVEVLIVNYNAGEALVRCVRSVAAQAPAVGMTVIDNASTDDSLEHLREQCGSLASLLILENPANHGFAAAVNQAVRQSGRDSPFLLILNPDCVLKDGCLDALVEALEGDPAAALAGPLVIDRDGQAMRGTLRRFPDPGRSFRTFTGLHRLERWNPRLGGVEMDAGHAIRPVEAEAVSGACMLLRRREFLAAGMMDEDYGLHCEDLDLMYRLRTAGSHCLFVPGARVYHEQGVSSRSRPLWAHWQKHRGMQRFFNKFQAGNYRLPVRWLVGAGIWGRYVVTLPLALFRK